jgi:hypothetical protein
MAQITVQEQLEAIRIATEKACQSKESARKFLRDAGIISDKEPNHKTTSGIKKSK